MVWKASSLQACEAISFSAARILVTIKKGLRGPFSLEINCLTVENVNVPFIEFFPFLRCQGLLFALFAPMWRLVLSILFCFTAIPKERGQIFRFPVILRSLLFTLKMQTFLTSSLKL